MNFDGIELGVCYYPEHWQKKDWKSDLDRMLLAGIKTIRIAEFAWSFIEEKEGEFDFSFFDEFLDLVETTEMKVIFCTPTATPPAWLTKKYPEVLNATMEGDLYQHGFRRHYNYNSPKYRELSARIVEKSASHYGKRKSIIGWQIDNEFNCEIAEFYSKSDEEAFREFLKNKYKCLEALNESWGTVFWNQSYTDWNQVDLPRLTPTNRVNPHRKLDYYRFISNSVCEYAKMQSDILKKYIKKGDFITTNGLFGNLDSHKLTRESLDFITYDSYPNFVYCPPLYKEDDDLRDRGWSKHLSEVRSISPNFGIMEQQSGANGSMEMMSPVPKPGQIKLWTMQSIAHGADFVSYFRWRTATMGTEMYWHGILDYSGRDNRRLKEISEIGKELNKIKEIKGSKYQAKVAVFRSYDNIWNEQADVWQHELNDMGIWGIFRACQRSHTPFDYIYENHMDYENIKKYDLIICPHEAMIRDESIKLFEKYVQAGGKMIFGCRNAFKDENGICSTEKLPAKLRKLTSTDVYEYTCISPDIEKVKIKWEDQVLETSIFNEELGILNKDTASIEARYCQGDYENSGALVKNEFGEGLAYYFGSVLEENIVLAFLDKLGLSNPYEEYFVLPKTCEIGLRKNEENGKMYFFILNYSHEQVEIEVKESIKNLMLGEYEKGKISLQAFETKIYEA